ncbi:DUF3883 domain-containing protein [Delftia sp. ASV31]|uniref:DUF3883 domain-containing protein n=1 Tax=Delftia sp. ASV31 TaxID=2795113 RepID=UPI0018ED086A|nr:DUF3883 domain-containing protein [Delftia sp. ASV31]
MARKLALKRLTASDLTLFKWHLANRPAGSQKAFNLDTRILVGGLYPLLGDPPLVPRPRYPLDLYLFGPGLATVNNLQRKILKQEKNWRLNGELIDNPVEDPERYNVLVPGDFALIEFAGDAYPTTANIALVSEATASDASLHAELSRRYTSGSMWLLDEKIISSVLASARAGPDHPLHEWIQTDVLEDAALGGYSGVSAVNARTGRRGISPEDFLRSRRFAEATGVAGEELLNSYFESELQQGRIAEFEWSSSVNAVSPFDFKIFHTNSAKFRLIDAKSTAGKFGNPIHLSYSELSRAVKGPEPYDIYRLYEISECGGKMRVARDIGPALRQTLEILETLPRGMAVDGISVKPEILNFSMEINFIENSFKE